MGSASTQPQPEKLLTNDDWIKKWCQDKRILDLLANGLASLSTEDKRSLLSSMNLRQERFDHLLQGQVEEYFRNKAYPLLKRNEVYRFVCGLEGQKTPSIKNLLVLGSLWRQRCNLFQKYFEAAGCLQLTFNDEIGCRRLLAYDIRLEQQASNSSCFVSKTHTLLTEYLSMRLTVERLEDWERVVQWMVQKGPSLEDFSDWGAYGRMTLAINEGVSLPTLKCLFQARGLKKIRQEHQRLIDWYFYFKKVVTFETAAELLWLESPEVLHDSIRTLQKLTTRSYLKPGNDYSQRYQFNPEILEILVQKGIRYDKAPQKEKTLFVKQIVLRIDPFQIMNKLSDPGWVSALQKLEDIGVYANLRDLLKRRKSFERQHRILASFYGSPRDRLKFAYFLSHYEKIQHKLGTIPLHILRLDVLKY